MAEGKGRTIPPDIGPTPAMDVCRGCRAVSGMPRMCSGVAISCDQVPVMRRGDGVAATTPAEAEEPFQNAL